MVSHIYTICVEMDKAYDELTEFIAFCNKIHYKDNFVELPAVANLYIIIGISI